MATGKDSEQDEQIRRNAERIARNEEAILRQTQALEQIRDHYYPAPSKPWKRAFAFCLKAICVVVAYAGVAETVDWYLNTRRSEKMAARCAEAARELFFGEGDAAGAKHFLEKAVEFDGAAIKYRLLLAYVKNMSEIGGLLMVGRPLLDEERVRVDAALAEATFLLKTAPEEPLAHVLAAQAHVLRGEKELALDAINRALAMAPDQPQLHVCACMVHFAAGDLAGALRHVDAAEHLQPHPPLVSFWKGYLALVVDHDAASARRPAEELARRAPRLPVSHFLLGQVCLAEKTPDLAAAEKSFRRALELAPDFSLAALGLSEIARRRGNPIVARLWCDDVLKRDPHAIKALEVRARLNAATGDWTAAVRDWTAAIDLAPFRADFYRERAAAAAQLKNEAQAAADLKTATALDSPAW